MGNRRDLVAEIEEIRARSTRDMYPVTIPFRMLALASAFERSPTLDAEFLRYIPIGTVACMESFFRAAIRFCIDAGDEFIERASALSQSRELKLDFQILRAVHGGKISVGELIAHVLPMNSLAQVESVMSAVIGQSFLSLVEGAHSRWAVEVEHKPLKPIVTDPDLVFRHVEEMFKLRHIYAHELGDSDRFDRDRDAVAARLQSAVGFLEASAEVVGNIVYPNAPLTQLDMNAAAASERAAVEQRIDKAYNELLSKLNKERRPRFAECQAAWKVFQERHAEFEASEYEGGSIMPLIYSAAARAVAEDRLGYLNRKLDPSEER